MEKDINESSKLWSYNHDTKWEKKEYPYLAGCKPEDVAEFISNLGFGDDPTIVMGDEFSFVAVFDHKDREEYLFHLEIDELVKIFFAETLPAMLHLIKDANLLINAHFRTLQLLQCIKDGDQLE